MSKGECPGGHFDNWPPKTYPANPNQRVPRAMDVRWRGGIGSSTPAPWPKQFTPPAWREFLLTRWLWQNVEMSGRRFYFAYGSNLSLGQMRERIGAKPKVIGAAYLENHRLGFTILSKGWKGGVADIVTEAGSKVWGVIYELTEEQLEKIDHYEGYKKGRDPKQNFYNRLEVEVVDTGGGKHKCLTYHAKVEENKWRKYLYHKPSDKYYEVIRKGGEDHGLPQEFFGHLKVASVTERNPVGIRMNDTCGMRLENE